MKLNPSKSFILLSLVVLLVLTVLPLVGCEQSGKDEPAVTLTEDAKALLAEVGLTPDDEGIYTLSEEADEREAQMQCIYSREVYPYVQDTVFRIRGEIGCYKTVEDPVYYVTIDIFDAEGEFYYTIEAVNPDRRIDDEVLDHIMSGDREYIVTGTFGYFKVEHRDNRECPMFFAESYELIQSTDPV